MGTWENSMGKTMGKPWENGDFVGKTMGKSHGENPQILGQSHGEHLEGWDNFMGKAWENPFFLRKIQKTVGWDFITWGKLWGH